VEIFEDNNQAGSSGEDAGLNLLAIFVQELEETVSDLEQKLVALETDPSNLDLINAIFRAFHNLKGSSTMVGLKTLPEIMHYAESAFDHVRSGRLTVTEGLISLLLEVFGAMRELREALKLDSKEGKKRYFGILAQLETIASEADKSTHQEVLTEGSKSANQTGSETAGEEDEFIKISRNLVEQLMLVVGDFMLVESSFQFLKSKYGSDWNFVENCQQLAHFSGKLQNTVLRMRLSPIKPIFSSMHRVVRATAAELGKKVSLEVNGTETLVDRTILDVIADPIMHMMRNAVDHAIETPEDRLQVGKPPEGQVTLAAFHRSGEVVIQVSDDGRGIDPNRVRQSAIRKGFITEAEAAALTDGEAQSLIFMPGFSGAEVVTSVSGRGVGMDVVKQVITTLGGNIDLLSNPGSGTTITMRLPLSMAISECLEFRLGDKSYAVPQICIDEVFSSSSPQVKEGMNTVNDGSLVLLLRDTPVPVLDLAKIFGIEGPQDHELSHIIQVRYGTTRFALLVGPIVGPCNIVCQPLPTVFASDAAFSGLTRRGDGSLMFQIDLARLATLILPQADAKALKGAKIRGGTQITSSDLRRLQQKIAIFNSYENFCVPVHSIKRVVSVEHEDLHQIGHRRFITLDDKTVPLIFVEEVLLNKPPIEAKTYSILIFTIEDRIFGMPMDNFGGIIRMPTEFDNTLRSDVITGTTVIDSQTTMVLDLHGLAIRSFGSEIRSTVRSAQKISRIAIAEDDPFFREQLIAFLKARDLECISFPDGLALKEYLLTPANVQAIDVVLTDIEMPRMDGLTLTRWIKGTEHTKQLPCIIITALTNKEVIKLAMSAGASAFVPKMAHQQVLQELNRIESGLDKMDSQSSKFALGAQKELSRRIVTFNLANDCFALPMEVLKEVSHPSPNLPIPNYPAWMNSVTAFRGKMIPVIDLRKLFKLKLSDHAVTQQAIVDYQGQLLALLFDGIGEVLLISQLDHGEGLSKATSRENELAQYLHGIFHKDKQLISLLDPNSLVKLYQQRGQAIVREENAA
jgi:two-component system chemotaxis sensor kinase CheA